MIFVSVHSYSQFCELERKNSWRGWYSLAIEHGCDHVATVLSVALSVLSSCVALRRGDHSSGMFVAEATLLLAALHVTVRAHERVDYDAARRRRRGALRALAGAPSSALTGMFAHRVALIAPAPPFAVLVWSMAGAAVTGGFHLLFVVHDHGMETLPYVPRYGSDHRQEP
jgi:hypothetical protein